MKTGASLALAFSLLSYHLLRPADASPLDHHDGSSVVLARALAPPRSIQDRQSNAFNPILSSVTSLGPISEVLNGVTDAMASLAQLAGPIIGDDVDAKDVEASKPCAAVTVVFAKGTSEGGNMGTFVGPSFVTAVKAALPGTTVNVQGVNYDGTIQGYLDGGSEEGVVSM